MPSITIEHKFQIGEIVLMKSIQSAWMLMPKPTALTALSGKRGQVLQVVSWLAETCPGGTQIHYHCRHASLDGCSVDLLRVNEVELMASETPPVESA